MIASEAAAFGAMGWDVDAAWRVIEPARAAGQLPGLVATGPSGVPLGWTCFLVHRHVLQVAMLVADRPQATAALVERVLASREALRAIAHTLFVRAAAPGLARVLAGRGFEVSEYTYRALDLTPPGTSRPALGAKARDRANAGAGVARPWHSGDEAGARDLLMRAYSGAPGVRPYAADGSHEAWADYLGGLLRGTACGTFLPACSLVVPGADGDLSALVLVTAMGPGTAHVAQVAVDPAVRGRGLGSSLLARVRDEAAGRGESQLTLLVSEDNAGASALYDGMGFARREVFVAAMRSTALVEQGRRTDRGSQHAAVRRQRRLAPLDPGHGAAPGQLRVGQRGK
jgi:ribosomal protein S18 acetylase RimI-like enzyme